MTTDYFAQKKAEVDAQRRKDQSAADDRRAAIQKADNEQRENLRDIIIPFFDAKAASIKDAGAYLKLEKEQTVGSNLGSRLRITLCASERDGSRAGLPVLISVSPSIEVQRIFPATTGRGGKSLEVIDIGLKRGDLPDANHLELLYRDIVNQFYGEHPV